VLLAALDLDDFDFIDARKRHAEFRQTCKFQRDGRSGFDDTFDICRIKLRYEVPPVV
jgi:hypothetical protein